MSRSLRSEPVTVSRLLLRSRPMPERRGDKNSSGRVLVVGGHEGMPGGVRLAGEAALRTGAGKLQIATVASVVPALGVAVPEAFVAGLPVDADGEISPEAAERVVELAGEADALVIGPGLMTPGSAAELVAGVVPHVGCALVIDALAMAFLTDHLGGLGPAAARTVLSPNATELATTLGIELPEDLASPEGERAMADAVARLARESGATVVSGADTSIIGDAEGNLWRDDTGGQGLAISGSGDVKAGIIAGLLARGMAPVDAALWADHAHGRCGERLAADYGRTGFLARDLVAAVPKVLRELES